MDKIKNNLLRFFNVGSGAVAAALDAGSDGLILSVSEASGFPDMFGAFNFHYEPRQIVKLAQDVQPKRRQTAVWAPVACYDDTRDLTALFDELRGAGVRGVVSYPSLSVYEGDFRQALSDEGITLEKELAALSAARTWGLSAAAYICSPEDAQVCLDFPVDAVIVPAVCETDAILPILRRHPAEPAILLQSEPYASAADSVQHAYQAGADGFWASAMFGAVSAEATLAGAVNEYKTVPVRTGNTLDGEKQ